MIGEDQTLVLQYYKTYFLVTLYLRVTQGSLYVKEKTIKHIS